MDVACACIYSTPETEKTFLHFFDGQRLQIIRESHETGNYLLITNADMFRHMQFLGSEIPDGPDAAGNDFIGNRLGGVLRDAEYDELDLFFFDTPA